MFANQHRSSSLNNSQKKFGESEKKSRKPIDSFYCEVLYTYKHACRERQLTSEGSELNGQVHRSRQEGRTEEGRQEGRQEGRPEEEGRSKEEEVVAVEQ